MSDIKFRLRTPANVFYEYSVDGGQLLRDAADYIEQLEKDAALGAFVREYVKEANAGWTIPHIYIQGAPSIETLDEALSNTK